MNNYKVYRYTFPDGKVYIGVTKNSIQKRHDQGYQHNIALQNAIRSVGFCKVETMILADNLTQEEAFEQEQNYIADYRSNEPDKGYNVSKGGKNTFEGLHHTEEHKRYMSRLYKGKAFTPEHKRHLKESHRAECKSVIRILTDGTEIFYESQRDAAKAVNGHPTNIGRACRSGRNYKDSTWRYERG